MSKLKVPKMDQWKVAYPNYKTYPFPQFNQTPLYYTQEGNILFIKTHDLNYILELATQPNKGEDK